MKWVTRERPKTDRIACPWLIKNFIDPDAEFLYVPPTRCSGRRARGCALLRRSGAKYTHRDGLCSFEVLVEEYEIDDPAVRDSHASSTVPTSATTVMPHPSHADCSLSPRASISSTSATTASSSCRCRSTTLSTPGARTRSTRAEQPREPHADRLHPASSRGASLASTTPTSGSATPARGCSSRTQALTASMSSTARRETFLHSIDDLPGVAGVLVDQEHDLLFTSDRGCARVSIFRCSDEATARAGRRRTHPNGLAYDRNAASPASASTSASRWARAALPPSIDVDSMSVIAEIALPGRPRWAAYDLACDLVYVNIHDPARDPADRSRRSCDRRLDRRSGRRAARPLDRRRSPLLRGGWRRTRRHPPRHRPRRGHPAAPRRSRRRLARPSRERLYIAVGDPGTVTVVDTAALELVETVSTEPGAHTLAWDPTQTTLYVFCPGSGGAALFTEARTPGVDARRRRPSHLPRPGAASVRLRTRQRPHRRDSRRSRPLGRRGRARDRRARGGSALVSILLARFGDRIGRRTVLRRPSSR